MPPAPKPAHLRVNRTKPTHGEYVTLAPLSAPILPPLSDFSPAPVKGGKWPRWSKIQWDAWREHPITQEWSATELALAIDTIMLHAILVADGQSGNGEWRLRLEKLGLTDAGMKVRRRLMPPGTDTPELTPVPAPTPIRPMPEAK